MCELHVSPHSPDTSTADTAFYTSMSFLHFAKLLAFPLVFIGETWAYTPPKTEVPKEEERRVFGRADFVTRNSESALTLGRVRSTSLKRCGGGQAANPLSLFFAAAVSLHLPHLRNRCDSSARGPIHGFGASACRALLPLPRLPDSRIGPTCALPFIRSGDVAPLHRRSPSQTLLPHPRTALYVPARRSQRPRARHHRTVCRRAPPCLCWSFARTHRARSGAAQPRFVHI